MPLDYLRALRPKQWIKNLIIAGPLIFSNNLFDADKLLLVIFAIALFSAAASAIYLVNDVADIEKDRLHPQKKTRPIAAGKVPVAAALTLAAILAAGSLAVGWSFDKSFGAILTLYVAINGAYSFWLKNVVIIDVMTLSMGFVFRVLAGAAAIAVPASDWIIMCTMLLALFLGFAKRRHELILLSDDADGHRKSLKNYSPYLLDQLIMIVTAATVMSYALYTVSPHTIEQFHTNKLIYTMPFVLYGIFRYLFLIHQREEGGNPTKVFFTDFPLIVNIGLWFAACIFIIYYGKIFGA